MEKIEVTRLSSKGQVVLPLDIRQRLHLEEGQRFVVLGDGDTVVLKRLEMPSFSSAQALVYKSRVAAKKLKLSMKQVKDAVRSVRHKS